MHKVDADGPPQDEDSVSYEDKERRREKVVVVSSSSDRQSPDSSDIERSYNGRRNSIRKSKEKNSDSVVQRPIRERSVSPHRPSSKEYKEEFSSGTPSSSDYSSSDNERSDSQLKPP